MAYYTSSSEVEGVNGKFFKDMKTIESSDYSRDPEVQGQLWDASVKLVGLQ